MAAGRMRGHHAKIVRQVPRPECATATTRNYTINPVSADLQRISLIPAFIALIQFTLIQFTLSPAIAAQSRDETKVQPITIVCFGDSTTAERGSLNVYAQRLNKQQATSGRTIQTINAGIGGNNTDQAGKRLVNDVLMKNPDIVIVQFGINDAAVDVWKTPPATQPRVSLENYKRNLHDMLTQIKATGAVPILMTPNPMAWTDKLRQLYGRSPYQPDDPDGFNCLLKEYSAACRELARSEKIHLIDIDNEFRKHDINSLLLDGMHPNDTGHALIAERLLPAIHSLEGTAATP